MKISYNWLKQFIKLDWEAERTAELLTDLGLEIEGVEPYQSVQGGLKGVVVGHVVSCEQHPNADRLKLTKVDVGDGDPIQIVCGAPNVAAGQKVPVATIGTILYDDKGNPWKIKKGKIRGEESHGMICAEDELGLGQGHDGIMVLDESLKPGTPCSEIFQVEDDIIFEIGLTPNRADAMSHFGVARDLRAGLIQQDIQLEMITPSVSSFRVDNRTLRIDVDVQDKALAPRYAGVTISGIRVMDSPKWLQNRLRAIGITPKNNVVDATNYVLHELGQPLHAFDAAKIAGNKIVVKTAEPGTKFTTLDDVERELHEEDLMICDAEKPMCIAGVFGGTYSGVTENTTSIFLESAYFNPVSIRKSAKRHNLNTDASFRFERGIDINNVEYALRRAALLIQEVAGGEITSDVVDLYPRKFEDFQVFLHYEKINRLIGQNLPEEVVKSILSSLEIKVNNITEAGMGLTIPSYRVDVRREADVIEEILRVFGYNNVKFGEKLNASISNSSRFEDYKIQNKVASQLIAQGFFEIMSNSLTSPKYNTLSAKIKDENNVVMLNPLSNDLSIMRRTLLFSGLEAIAYNINRKQADLKLFEFGNSYHQFGEERVENKHLALFLTGNKTGENWNNPHEKSNFFYAKGIISGVLERLRFEDIKYTPVKSDVFSEGITFNLDKVKLVDIGVVNSEILKTFDIKQEVLYADFYWDNILEHLQTDGIKYKEIPKFPEIRRDFALLLDTSVQFSDIYTTARQAERKLLKNINLFDVYEGDKLPEGKKSYAVSFTFRDENKTLTDKQVDKIMDKFRQAFEKQLQAELR
ncbi:phenylalanine--tRNA ligase subunit beta [Sinomicrobium weinanense]|uniref:Phenylalanine--tRNA ligase beta subunit n=1 Tax=Sinomicrobium weinanense TaxID=2842200 RepID=A0A926JQX7_9FLAO|nr:phenylalanine--tRNA ligase subunit beta [Sinomicrobium weinanense]MBC9795657.1 phenylalanine--tRNA ligase subunit beta [Sinomicrobium weinanense]MBU3122826.1 phenylalanine--tRNA ligase subunit beta [Sinomicrobium weinanense]